MNNRIHYYHIKNAHQSVLGLIGCDLDPTLIYLERRACHFKEDIILDSIYGLKIKRANVKICTKSVWRAFKGKLLF